MCFRFRFLVQRSAQKSLQASSLLKPKSVQVSFLAFIHGNVIFALSGGELGKDSCKGDTIDTIDSGGGIYIQVNI